MGNRIDPNFPAFFKASIDLAASQDLSESQAKAILIPSLVFIVLAVVLVALRFLLRFARDAPFALDDWLILVALFVLGGTFAILIQSMLVRIK